MSASLTDEERYNLLNSEEKNYAGSGFFHGNLLAESLDGALLIEHLRS